MNQSRNHNRCGWADAKYPIYVEYHDTEWGVPVFDDDQKHFEMLTLESAQAGLSWLTVLRKREGYRRAFADFDPVKVARFTPKRIEKLLANPNIIRNRQKVTCAISNAREFLKVQNEFGSFSAFIWQFVDGKPIQNRWEAIEELPPNSSQSDALSRELKQRGFKFVGSTTMYAHMQAAGLVNDHLVSCFRHGPCARMGRR